MTGGIGYQLGHRPALDGLRGVAILLVVAGHMAVPGLDSGGWPGVTLFFALSGFLITSLLLEERARTGGINLRRFYERRARRLLPALALFLLVMVLWGVRDQVLPVVFYVSNWTGIAAEDGPMAHLWSLAVEEQFYILWPLGLLALWRWKTPRPGAGFEPATSVARQARTALYRSQLPRRSAPTTLYPALWIVLGLAALSAGLRLVQFVAGPFWLAYTGTHARADALLLGCALAIALHAGMTWRPGRWLVALAGLVILASAFPSGEWQGRAETAQLLVGLPLTAIASTILVAAAATSTPRALTVPPLRGFGKISYGLYLWHSPLSLFGWLGIALSVAISTASYLGWERRWLSRHLVSDDPGRLVARGRVQADVPLDRGG